MWYYNSKLTLRQVIDISHKITYVKTTSRQNSMSLVGVCYCYHCYNIGQREGVTTHLIRELQYAT